MRASPKTRTHPDIGENGRQPFDGSVAWSEMRGIETFRMPVTPRRPQVANGNDPRTVRDDAPPGRA